MAFKCKLCMKKVKYDELSNIRALKCGEKDFCDVLKEICDADGDAMNVTSACQRCVDSIKSYYTFRENLRTNLELKENNVVSGVKQFLANMNEETTVINFNQCLIVTPKSKVDEIQRLKLIQPVLKEPKVSLQRLNTLSDVTNQKCDSADDDFDAIAIKMEPTVEIEIDSGLSSDTSSKWTFCDLTASEKEYIRENLHLPKNRPVYAKSIKCKICKRQFVSRSKGVNHIKRDHLMKRGSKLRTWLNQKVNESRFKVDKGCKYKCVLCAKTDTTMIFDKCEFLRRHLAEHRKSANFQSLMEDEHVEDHFDATSKGYDHPFGFLV